MTLSLRPVWAEVDLDAVAHNVHALRALVAPASVLAVVKADAYGHGALPVARAAIDAGAAMLGVALVEEGVALRHGGVQAPVLVLSEPVAAAADAVVEHRLVPAVYTAEGIDALGAAAARASVRLAVHLKVDTGMHRVGCRPDDAVALASRVVANSALELDGVLTHLAVADEVGHDYNDRQLDRFDDVLAALAAHDIRPRVVHAANTAAALTIPRARYDMVRPGIGLYGIEPAPGLGRSVDLRPVLSVKAQISFVKRVGAGEAVSYGLRRPLARDSWLATVPIGYADGVPRGLGKHGGEVLVGGRRRPIAGTVTMDQILVDLGDDECAAGDEVVLIGAQGDERITVQEWADRLDTIGYEIVCGIGPRVPRRFSGAAAPRGRS